MYVRKLLQSLAGCWPRYMNSVCRYRNTLREKATYGTDERIFKIPKYYVLFLEHFQGFISHLYKEYMKCLLFKLLELVDLHKRFSVYF